MKGRTKRVFKVWDRNTHVHTGTWFLVLRVITGTAVCTKYITAQHGTAPHHRAEPGTARRYAVLLTQLSCAELGVHFS